MKHRMLTIAWALALISPLALAATHVSTADETLGFPAPTVEAVQATLAHRSDVTTKTINGWTQQEVPGVAVEWLFVPKTDAAYPALIKLVGDVAGTGQAGEAVLCGGALPACTALIERERQDAQHRGKRFQGTIVAK
jgi:hypothetical protein